MRRTIHLALVAALLLVPAAAHAADPIELIRDCADDGVLQGDYTPSELREARNELPTDIDEYSDCRDVLSRALSGGETQGGGGAARGGGTGGGATTGATGGGTSPAAPSPAPTQPTRQPRGPGDVPILEQPQDWQAVDRAHKEGARAVEDAKPLAPGASRLAADVGRNSLPGSLIALLALLGAAAISAALPFVRRRVLARRQP